MDDRSAGVPEDSGSISAKGENSGETACDMESDSDAQSFGTMCSTPTVENTDPQHCGARKTSPPSSVALEKDLFVNLASVNGAHGADANNSNFRDGECLKPEETAVFGCMKKDDSGIDIEKSPTSIRECSLHSDGEGNDSISESLFTDSATGSRTNSMSEYKGKSTTEDEHLEMEDTAFGVDVISPSEDSKSSVSQDTKDNGMSSVSDAVENSESSSCDMKTSRRRKSSSSDSDGADDESANKKKDTDSDDEDYSAFEKVGKVPKHTWLALSEFRQRENGCTNRLSSQLFQKRVSGSLRMVQRLELMAKLVYHEGCVNTLSFNRIGSLLASGSDDLNIVLWNWVRSKPALIYDSGHRSNVFQAKFMPYSGDCHVISCARDGQVRLAELSLTGICKGTKKLAQHKGAAHKLALEYDSPYTFLSCGEDAVMFEIDLRNDKSNRLGTTKENDRKVALYSIHSNPSNPNQYCVGGRDHFIRVYDKRKIAESVNNGVLKKFCPQHLINSDIKANVTCACYNYNGSEILGTFNDEDVYLFDSSHSDGADFIHRYKGHRNNATVKGVNFYGPKSEFIMSGSDCGHVFMWDKETEEVVQFMEGDVGGVVNVLEPHPMAPVLATSGLDHDIKVWAPTAESATDLKGLRKVMRSNRRNREYERTNEPEVIDGQMLWFLLHHIRRSSRRRARQDGEHLSSPSDSSEEDSEEDEDTPERMQCSPS